MLSFKSSIHYLIISTLLIGCSEFSVNQEGDPTEVENHGHSVGNGGSFLIQEFIYYGKKAAEVVKLQNSDHNEENDILELTDSQFFEVVSKTPIIVSSQPFLDNRGSEVDARLIEFRGEKALELYDEPWLKRLAYPDKMFRLVFHEYLRVLGINDDQDQVSSKLNLENIVPHTELFTNLSKAFVEAEKADHRNHQGFFAGWCIEKENDFYMRQSIYALYHFNNGMDQREGEGNINYMLGEVPGERYMLKDTFENMSEPERRDYVQSYKYSLLWAKYFGGYLSSHVPAGSERVPDGVNSVVFQVRKSNDFLIAAFINLGDPSGSKRRIFFDYDENGNLIIPEEHIFTICYYVVE